MTKQLSSSWTIFLRLFLPVFWGVFFGCFTLALFINQDQLGPLLGGAIAKWVFLGGYLVGLLILYFSLLRIYRVDADHAFFYVSNYFKTYKYPFHRVAKISEQDLGIALLITIGFEQRYSFGKNIHFLAHKKNYTLFLKENADAFSHLLDS